MSTERLAKWSKESKEFFEKAKDNSIVLDLIISYSCASQTGEGFEELVNTINSESIKRKVKKVIITDTSYLYRHDNPEFAKYADPSIPTQWYLKNKETIEKLEVEKEVKSWAVGLNTKEFKEWYEKIRRDFEGNENGFGVVLEFRDKVMQASIAAYKKNNRTGCDVKGEIEFMLEETAYACAFLNGSALVYPSKLAECILITAERYRIRINHLKYRISLKKIDIGDVNKEVLSFIKDKVNNANFFVIDKYGNHIYKNYALSSIVGEINAKPLSNEAWKNTVSVIKDGKERSFEEIYKGKIFLTIKSPLVINDKVEGIIGLAVDITDRKKKEEELYKIAKEVSHDIASPVSSLKIIDELYEGKLLDEDKRMLKAAITSIEKMAGKMLSKYRLNERIERGEKVEVQEKEEEEYVNVDEILWNIIEEMRYRNKGRKVDVEIKYGNEKGSKILFMRGDSTDFKRMMINIINNGIEAVEGKKVEIEVRYEEKGEEVEIRVKDNGEGMPKEMAEKLLKGEEIGTTKKDGYGIGTQQIMGTIKAMKGKLEIDSKEGEWTEFILTFPKADKSSMIVSL